MPIPLATFPLTRPTGWTPAYGGAPAVPLPGEAAGAAITSNLGNLANLYNLAGGLNQFQTAQAALQYARNLPDYSGLLAQSSRNIGARLRGELPGDVINQIMRTGAERGILTGQAQPGQNVNAAILAALGRTSEQEQILGEQQLTEAIRRTPTAPLFNIASMLTSPEEWQQAQAAADVYGAAPDPAAAAAERERAAERGIAAGAGAVGGAPTMRYGMPSQAWMPSYGAGMGGDAMETIVAPSLGGGTFIGGQYYPEGTTPASAYQNWMNWWSAPPTAITGQAPGPDFEEMFYYGDTPVSDIPTSALGPSGTQFDYFPDLYSMGTLEDLWGGGDLGG